MLYFARPYRGPQYIKNIEPLTKEAQTLFAVFILISRYAAIGGGGPDGPLPLPGDKKQGGHHQCHSHPSR